MKSPAVVLIVLVMVLGLALALAAPPRCGLLIYAVTNLAPDNALPSLRPARAIGPELNFHQVHITRHADPEQGANASVSPAR
jgi:hypothetical protein